MQIDLAFGSLADLAHYSLHPTFVLSLGFLTSIYRQGKGD